MADTYATRLKSVIAESSSPLSAYTKSAGGTSKHRYCAGSCSKAHCSPKIEHVMSRSWESNWPFRLRHKFAQAESSVGALIR